MKMSGGAALSGPSSPALLPLYQISIELILTLPVQRNVRNLPGEGSESIDDFVVQIDTTVMRRSKTRFAKRLRKRMTKAETILWDALRSRCLDGLKFRRQVPVGWYIADFLCFEQSLIIEIDGPIHDMQKEYDAFRETYLSQKGYRVIHFTNTEVINDLSFVLSKIKARTTHIILPPFSR